MSTLVICDGDAYAVTFAVGEVASGAFIPPIGTVSVSDNKLSVDGGGAALESDIDSALGAHAFTGVGTDTSVGAAVYDSITGITLSTVLKKGDFVVLKVTVDFQINVAAPWVIPPSTPSSKYIAGYKIACTMSWTLTQLKLKA